MARKLGLQRSAGARPSSRRRKPATFAPVHPNAGIEVEYRRKLDRLIAEMNRSTLYWLRASYRSNEPRIAQDAPPDASGTGYGPPSPRARLPANALRDAVRGLARRWQKRFDEAAPELAAWFAQAVGARSDSALKASLKKGGFAVEFRPTPAQRDIMQATVNQNVSLIKSIPAENFAEIEGLVMRSVQTGRDLSTLTDALEARFGITRRRAVTIARDQNNKATSALQRGRQTELGITEAIWMHSGGGRHPRPKHVAANGSRYEIATGLAIGDKGQHVFPGEEINCFPTSVEIQRADGVEVAYRRWYDGELTEIVTRSGKTLRATPNHPVLTPHGWVSIGALHEGDYVVELSDHGALRIMPERNNDDAVPSICQVFDALCQSNKARTEVGRRHQFHGDGDSNRDVDIVFAARPLWLGRQPSGDKCIRHLYFRMADQARFSLSFVRQFAARCFGASARYVRGFGEFLPALETFPFHPEPVRSAPAANGASGFQNPSGDQIAGNIVGAGQGQNAGAPFVLGTNATQIIRTSKEAFRGHVFNLQTLSGWYVAGGIVTHNCRCVSRAVIPGFN